MARKPFEKSQTQNAAAKYEEFFVPAIGAPLARDLVALAALQPGERVLDAACGTGIVARDAAAEVGPTGAVTGVDINPGMLAEARRAAPPETSIDWREASVEAMPLPSDSFDAVLCQLSLQFVSDRAGALQEMRRVLVNDGRVCLNVPGPASPVFEAIADAMEHRVGAEAAGFVRHVFSLHDTEEIRALLERAGFRDPDVHAETKVLRLPAARDFLWQYVQSTPLAGMAANLAATARHELEDEVVERCENFAEDGGLACPQRIVEARAWK